VHRLSAKQPISWLLSSCDYLDGYDTTPLSQNSFRLPMLFYT